MPACPQCRAPCADDARKCLACGAATSAALFAGDEDTLKSGPKKTPGGTLRFEGLATAPRTGESGERTTGERLSGDSVETSSGAEADPLIGQTPLGQYRILRKIGEGGFGAVYIAEQTGVGRKAVIKVLRKRHGQSDIFIRRFQREAAVLAALDHHNLVRLYNFGELDDGQLFLAMEYGGDRTLAEEIQLKGHLAPERALRIAEQVCAALAEAHEHGIVHRDLKPHNLLLGEKSGADWVKVVDVGIAKILDTSGLDLSDSTLTAQGAMIGTPAYLSPEQARGLPVDARSDIYAMGIVLYEMLTAHLPINGETPIDFVRAHSIDPPRPIRDTGVQVPAYIEAIVMRALEKDAAKRFASADEMAEAIGEARRKLRRAALPKKRYVFLGGLVGAVVGAAALVAALRHPATRSSVAPIVQADPVPAPPPAPAAPPPPAPAAVAPPAPAAAPPVAAAPAAARPEPQRVSPADTKARRLIAQASRASGDDAVDKLEQALDLEPGAPVKGRALRALAELYEGRRNRAKALEYYQLYVRYCPPEQMQALREKIARLKSELYGR